ELREDREHEVAPGGAAAAVLPEGGVLGVPVVDPAARAAPDGGPGRGGGLVGDGALFVACCRSGHGVLPAWAEARRRRAHPVRQVPGPGPARRRTDADETRKTVFHRPTKGS